MAEDRATAEVQEARQLVDGAMADAAMAKEAELRDQHGRTQAAIATAQQQAFARVGAIRQEAGRWVKEANEEAAAARAAAAKAEAEVAELRRKMEERVRAAVLKTQAKERERGAAAVARERQAGVAMMDETRKEVE